MSARGVNCTSLKCVTNSIHFVTGVVNGAAISGNVILRINGDIGEMEVKFHTLLTSTPVAGESSASHRFTIAWDAGWTLL
jgi:hypothetical protein